MEKYYTDVHGRSIQKINFKWYIEGQRAPKFMEKIFNSAYRVKLLKPVYCETA